MAADAGQIIALVTRPEVDATALAKRLTKIGVKVIRAPIFDIHFLPAEPVKLTAMQAVVFTSGNGVRAFGEHGYATSMLAVAVGAATAELAAATGFTKVLNAGGNLKSLVKLLNARLSPADGALFYPAAADTAGELEGLLPEFTICRRALYRAEPVTALPETVTANLKRLTHALFYSPRTAKLFCGLAAGLHLDRVTALALSPAVASELRRLTWRAIRTAARPTTQSLLSLFEFR